MHRQSVGSTAAAANHIHSANNGLIFKQTSSSPELLQKKLPLSDEEDEKQNKKPLKTTPFVHPQKFIHLIPILTLLCIFILYLNSHDPSQNDLAQFNGFKTLSKPIDSINIDKIRRVSETQKHRILAIRSKRNLQEVYRRGSSTYQINRKIGVF